MRGASCRVEYMQKLSDPTISRGCTKNIIFDSLGLTIYAISVAWRMILSIILYSQTFLPERDELYRNRF